MKKLLIAFLLCCSMASGQVLNVPEVNSSFLIVASISTPLTVNSATLTQLTGLTSESGDTYSEFDGATFTAKLQRTVEVSALTVWDNARSVETPHHVEIYHNGVLVAGNCTPTNTNRDSPSMATVVLSVKVGDTVTFYAYQATGFNDPINSYSVRFKSL